MYRFSITTSVTVLSAVGSWLEGISKSQSRVLISSEDLFQIQLAVQEAAATGVKFQDELIPPPDFDGSRESGFGIFIIRQIMEDVKYGRTKDHKNFIRLKKLISTKEVETHDCN